MMRWIIPVPGYVLSGGEFGASRAGRMHLGLDIGVAGLKPRVLSMSSGIVHQVRFLDKTVGSKAVVVEDYYGNLWSYLHITSSLGRGDSIRVGTVLGHVADRDRLSTGPHLHLQLQLPDAGSYRAVDVSRLWSPDQYGSDQTLVSREYVYNAVSRLPSGVRSQYYAMLRHGLSDSEGVS